MSTIIKASSKHNLSKNALKEIAYKAFGRKSSDLSICELSGGLCNSVYLLEMNDKKLVAKIAPPKDAVMMRHEKNIINTEADMLKIMQELDVPAPCLVMYDDSFETINVPYFVMTYIEGEPLMFMDNRPEDSEVDEIKYNLGKICRKISSVQGEYFGIPALPETYSTNLTNFVNILFEMLLDDIIDKSIDLPEVTKDELLDIINQCSPAFSEVTQPVLIHNDTWEGNLMIKDAKLMGLIDFAAMMYGDPLMNHDFHDFSPEPNPYFLKGYGWEEGFSAYEKIRIRVYKIWLSLGMIAERGYRNYEDKNLYLWVIDEFKKDIKRLKKEMHYVFDTM